MKFPAALSDLLLSLIDPYINLSGHSYRLMTMVELSNPGNAGIMNSISSLCMEKEDIKKGPIVGSAQPKEPCQ